MILQDFLTSLIWSAVILFFANMLASFDHCKLTLLKCVKIEMKRNHSVLGRSSGLFDFFLSNQ